MKIREVKTHYLKVPIGNAIRDSSFNVAFIGLPVVRLATEDGLEGWGFNWNTAGGGEFPKEMLDRYMAQHIIGQDALMRKKLIAKLSNVENFGWDFRLGRNGLANMGPFCCRHGPLGPALQGGRTAPLEGARRFS